MTPARTRLVALVATGALLALTACGPDKPAAAATPAALSGVKVVGDDPKKAPAVTLTTTPLTVTKTTTQVLRSGAGATLTDKDIASVSMEVVNGKDGKVVNSNYETGAAGFFLGQADLLAGLKKGLTGRKVGSRVLLAVPPADGFGTQGATQLGIGANDTMLFVIDVASSTAMLPKATGTAVAPAKGFPTVVFDDAKPATITVPKGAKAPTATVVQPLIAGAGPAVKTGQTVRVLYTGALWRNNEVFDSSFSHPDKFLDFTAGAGGVIKGWDKAVVGQKVGSRLIVVVPPADGYGPAGQGTIKGTDTLAFVVDILAAY